MPVTERIVTLLALSLLLSAEESVTEQGIAAFSRGQYGVAERQLREALAKNPADEHARTFLALTRAATGHVDQALADLTAAWEKPGTGGLKRLAGLALAQCRVSRGEVAAAIPVVTQLLAMFPDDADVLFLAARVHMKAFNNATHEMFLRTPSSYRVNQLSAEIFETQGRYAEAIAEYKKAIEKNARALDLHFRLGRAILLESHDPEALTRARAEFEAELALNNEDAAAEFQIGQILAAQSKPEEALRRYERALSLRPDFPEAALAVAKSYIQDKQYGRAIPLLERAVSLQPRNEAAHYNLMIAYRNAGQADKARAEQQELDRLRRPAEGEFTEFLKKLGEKPPQP